VAEDNLKLAFDISNETSPFPEILGRICPHEKLCEGSCTLYDGHGAITIGAAEIFISEKGLEAGFELNFQPLRENVSVAIIGAGPAGLSCAHFLLRAGIKPVIYERSDKAGGLLTYGIPGFKLEKDIVEKRIDVLKRHGLEIKLNTEVGKDISFETLQKNHQAIFLSTGATEGKVLEHQAYNQANIFMAVPFLTNVQKKLAGKKYDKSYSVENKKVVVIGGGDTAMDCMRTAIREGAKTVKCYYRRDETSMPGSRKEVKAAKEEGVEFVFNKQPKRFCSNERDLVYGIEFNTTKLIEGTSKTTILTEIENSNEIVEADIFIMALGFDNEKIKFLEDHKIGTNSSGIIKTLNENETSLEGVFAGGDAVRGADLAVRAAYDGREAANKITEYVLKNKL
jgi:glutamate synthase (NADPH/NADH) small chain